MKDPLDLDIYSNEQMEVSAMFDSIGQPGYQVIKTAIMLGIINAIRSVQATPLAVLRRVCYEEASKKKNGNLTPEQEASSDILSATYQWVECNLELSKRAVLSGIGKGELFDSIRKAAEDEA